MSTLSNWCSPLGLFVVLFVNEIIRFIEEQILKKTYLVCLFFWACSSNTGSKLEVERFETSELRYSGISVIRCCFFSEHITLPKYTNIKQNDIKKTLLNSPFTLILMMFGTSSGSCTIKNRIWMGGPAASL